MASPTKALPNNFSASFLPDRRLIADLIGFARQEGSGTKEEISEETGIPTGKSTGKVEPMIYYALGMGLIRATKQNQIWQLSVTELGALIHAEDTFLSEPQTLWLLHLLLCRRNSASVSPEGVATAWFELFTNQRLRLREDFTLTDYHDCLTRRIGEMSYTKSLASLVIRTYFTDNCWALAEVLQSQDNRNVFKFAKAPLNKDMQPVYAVYLYSLWDELFSTEQQLSLEQFSNETGFVTATGWSDIDISQWLNSLSDKGLVQVDRQTGTSMILRLKSTKEVIDDLYSELV